MLTPARAVVEILKQHDGHVLISADEKRIEVNLAAIDAALRAARRETWKEALHKLGRHAVGGCTDREEMIGCFACDVYDEIMLERRDSRGEEGP